ncbi:MAG: TIGR03936 family radical SAM-associated protein [Lachnospiraceae bacterium]|jgi:radical SAM-linked protein|nr:TIGR03936 family radical SAM-associated protein [Lachnospiraceae bacterium]
MKIRIKFSKLGTVRFIGHLDLMRFFQKALRRAGVDMMYSGGYSPHPIMAFAAPLGVGIESIAEYMDIETQDHETPTHIQESLRRHSVPGIEILSVRELPADAQNAMASVAAARYMVTVSSVPSNDLQHKIDDLLSSATIVVSKKSKHGTRALDIRSGIYELFVTGQEVHMLLNASSEGNIKPSLVMDVLVGQEAVRTLREELYTTNPAGKLVPMEEIQRIGTERNDE